MQNFFSLNNRKLSVLFCFWVGLCLFFNACSTLKIAQSPPPDESKIALNPQQTQALIEFLLNQMNEDFKGECVKSKTYWEGRNTSATNLFQKDFKLSMWWMAHPELHRFEFLNSLGLSPLIIFLDGERLKMYETSKKEFFEGTLAQMPGIGTFNLDAQIMYDLLRPWIRFKRKLKEANSVSIEFFALNPEEAVEKKPAQKANELGAASFEALIAQQKWSELWNEQVEIERVLLVHFNQEHYRLKGPRPWRLEQWNFENWQYQAKNMYTWNADFVNGFVLATQETELKVDLANTYLGCQERGSTLNQAFKNQVLSPEIFNEQNFTKVLQLDQLLN